MWFPCSGPYDLEQDCSNWSGPTRRIKIGRKRARSASTADGRVVLVAHPYSQADGASERLTPATRSAVTAVIERLAETDIKIKKAVPAHVFGMEAGYLLELDSDGYSVLKEHTLEPATLD